METNINFEQVYKNAKHGRLNEEDVYEPETDFSDYDVNSDESFQDNEVQIFEAAIKAQKRIKEADSVYVVQNKSDGHYSLSGTYDPKSMKLVNQYKNDANGYKKQAASVKELHAQESKQKRTKAIREGNDLDDNEWEGYIFKKVKIGDVVHFKSRLSKMEMDVKIVDIDLDNSNGSEKCDWYQYDSSLGPSESGSLRLYDEDRGKGFPTYPEDEEDQDEFNDNELYESMLREMDYETYQAKLKNAKSPEARKAIRKEWNGGKPKKAKDPWAAGKKVKESQDSKKKNLNDNFIDHLSEQQLYELFGKKKPEIDEDDPDYIAGMKEVNDYLGVDDNDQTKAGNKDFAVLQYIKEHPNQSPDKVAKKLDISKNQVLRVIQTHSHKLADEEPSQIEAPKKHFDTWLENRKEPESDFGQKMDTVRMANSNAQLTWNHKQTTIPIDSANAAGITLNKDGQVPGERVNTIADSFKNWFERDTKGKYSLQELLKMTCDKIPPEDTAKILCQEKMYFDETLGEYIRKSIEKYQKTMGGKNKDAEYILRNILVAKKPWELIKFIPQKKQLYALSTWAAYDEYESYWK